MKLIEVWNNLSNDYRICICSGLVVLELRTAVIDKKSTFFKISYVSLERKSVRFWKTWVNSLMTEFIIMIFRVNYSFNLGLRKVYIIFFKCMCIPIRCWATRTRCCWPGKSSSQLTGAARSPDTHLSHTCSLSHGETTTEKEREESREEWLADGQDLCTSLTSDLSLCVFHTLAFIFSYL